MRFPPGPELASRKDPPHKSIPSHSLPHPSHSGPQVLDSVGETTYGVTQISQAVERVHLERVDLGYDELGIAHRVSVEHCAQEGGPWVGGVVAAHGLPDDTSGLVGEEGLVIGTEGVLLSVPKLLNVDPIEGKK